MDRTGKIGLLLLGLLFKLTAHAEEFCLKNYKLPSMGSFFELQLSEPCNAQKPTQLLLEIQERLNQLESEFSLYQTHSQLSKLNAEKKADNLSTQFIGILKSALEISRKTKGAFDISIEPLVAFVKNSFETKNRAPSDLEIQKIKDLVNWERISIRGSTVRISKGQALTFDGIVKGSAVDRVAQTLKEKGKANFLINFSGNMYWQGRPPSEKKWNISIWNPQTRQKLPLQIKPEGAIASSGSEHQAYTEDRAWNHILDPRSLRPVNHWIAATVMGPVAEVVDALSTACFVMTETEIKSQITREFPDYQVWVIEKSGKIRCLNLCGN